MHIEGWAYKENEEEKAQKNRTEEFNLVVNRSINDYVVVERKKPGYAHITYTGHLKPGHPGFTVRELAVFLDEGNLCFGGRGSIKGDNFEITVYTD